MSCILLALKFYKKKPKEKLIENDFFSPTNTLNVRIIIFKLLVLNSNSYTFKLFEKISIFEVKNVQWSLYL